ncbi:hypothetical protein [Streptomyces achromogenes]
MSNWSYALALIAEAALQQLAVDQPEILRTETSEYNDRVSYYARRLP